MSLLSLASGKKWSVEKCWRRMSGSCLILHRINLSLCLRGVRTFKWSGVKETGRDYVDSKKSWQRVTLFKSNNDDNNKLVPYTHCTIVYIAGRWLSPSKTAIFSVRKLLGTDGQTDGLDLLWRCVVASKNDASFCLRFLCTAHRQRDELHSNKIDVPLYSHNADMYH